MAAAVIRLLLALVAVNQLFTISYAHGGSFHGPDTPKSRGYPYAVIKQCTNWLDGPGVRGIPGATNIRMSGRTLVQYYFYKNCSSSASSSVQLEVVLTGTVGGKSRVPLPNITFTGGVMNRPCVDIKSPAAQLYNLRNTPDPLDKGNYLYWNSATTGAQGNITGHGANSGKPRGAAGQIRSVVMFLGSSHTPSPKRMLLMTNSSGGIVENLDAWRNKVAFCCNLGGPDKIVNPKWETALDNLPGTDC